MNRKQKIIVSVTGIFLVLLILMGLTYAYFLTRINGNPNNESISVTTANLAVTYSEDTNDLITSTNPIVPGEFTSSKTFTVTNSGNAETEYVVVLENMKVVYATTSGTQIKDAETTFVYPEDLRYTLTCTNKDGSTCNNIQETGFPINGGVMVGNKIPLNGEQTYTLTLTYVDTGYDQSVDMNKTLTGKINIYDAREINPYANDTTLLANRIINNALNVTEEEKTLHYAEFMPIPLTTPAVETNGENESTLSMSSDELGTTYYYRGNVENNYINFNDMCWRIVRIEGDGSIKLVLEDQYDTCEQDTDTDNDGKTYTGDWNIDYEAYGYIENDEAQLFADYENYSGGMKDKLNSWLTGTLSDDTLRFSTENQNKLKSTKVCIGNTENAYDYPTGALLTQIEKQSLIEEGGWFYYKNGVRLDDTGVTPYATYLCDEYGKSINEYKIYPLTADEVVYAGGKAGSSNYNYYLLNDYQEEYANWWWTLSPSSFDGNYGSAFAFLVLDDGDVSDDYSVDVDDALRPVVSILESSAIYNGGDGSRLNPYTLK